MTFLTPTFLAGLAGVALPVLIHLLTRDRIRRVEFSTLRFFVRTSGRVLRRKRFREMILLLLRAVVCGLLAVAFARPLLDRPRDDGLEVVSARTARVVLADVSASMARGDAPTWLRTEAIAALEDLSAGTDAVALLTFADHVTVEAPLSRSFRRAEAAATNVRPGDGATNIAQALRWADAQLRRARARTREIELISDLQRSGWRDFRADFQLSPGVKLTVRPIEVGTGDRGVAVQGCSFPETTVLDREPRAVTVQLVNYSDEPRQAVPVRLKMGGSEQKREVNLRGGGTATATFRRVFETPGDHRGTVELAGRPAFYFNARVIPKIKTLLIDGGPAAGGLSDAAFYVETALAPGADVSSSFERFTRRVSAVAPSDVADVQVAALVEVSSLRPAVVRALDGLLQRGGGVLFLPGEATDAPAFNRAFADVAPCKLRAVRTGRLLQTGGIGASLARIDYEHPIFEVFRHPRHGDLSLPKFRRYWEVTDSQLARVLARFDDNRPAVLAREIGAGVSMLLAASPRDAWTDFPRQTTFLPYIWQTLKYLAARTEERTTYLVGESLPVPAEHTLIGPGGKTDAAGRFAARRPGFYTLQDPNGRSVATFAVNRDPAEADPTTVAADEIIQAVERPAEASRLAVADGEDDGPDRDDLGLWWWVVVAVTVLLAAELLLGNKTLRH